jgi:hypothetical protein
MSEKKPEESASTLQGEVVLGIARLEAVNGMARYRVESLTEYSQYRTLAERFQKSFISDIVNKLQVLS